MQRGMYHKKMWLFHDGNAWAAVHGSGHATTRGLLVNGEQMTVGILALERNQSSFTEEEVQLAEQAVELLADDIVARAWQRRTAAEDQEEAERHPHPAGLAVFEGEADPSVLDEGLVGDRDAAGGERG